MNATWSKICSLRFRQDKNGYRIQEEFLLASQNNHIGSMEVGLGAVNRKYHTFSNRIRWTDHHEYQSPIVQSSIRVIKTWHSFASRKRTWIEQTSQSYSGLRVLNKPGNLILT